MGRSPCCDKMGLKRGPWTPKEDHKLASYIKKHGHGSWRALPPKAGLERCGKSCRLRWTNYLRPDIKRGKFSLQEEQTIIQLHALLGNRWSAIATHLPKRTDNEIKNYWNTHVKKKLTKMGIDPMTHKPINYALIGSRQPKDIANLSHMTQWERTRLEAEARIVRESKLFSNYHDSLFTKKSKITILPPQLPRPPCLDILKAWQAIKPRKDILTTIVNMGSLESPTSIFNFSDKTPTVVGMIHENSLVDMNYVGKPINNNYRDDRGKGIMESSLEARNNMMDLVISSSDDSFKFPSYVKGFEDLPLMPSSITCLASNASSSTLDNIGLEDMKIGYWSDVLNVATTPMDAMDAYDY